MGRKASETSFDICPSLSYVACLICSSVLGFGGRTFCEGLSPCWNLESLNGKYVMLQMPWVTMSLEEVIDS